MDNLCLLTVNQKPTTLARRSNRSVVALENRSTSAAIDSFVRPTGLLFGLVALPSSVQVLANESQITEAVSIYSLFLSS